MDNVQVKKKRNEQMYEQNANVLEQINEAIDELAKGNLEKTTERLEKGKELVLKRMKVIKLADREDWHTVREYLSDDLASDENDEKLIAQAIKSAAAKKEKRTKLKRDSRLNVNSWFTFHNRNETDHNRGASSRLTGYKINKGDCWRCGRLGHFEIIL